MVDKFTLPGKECRQKDEDGCWIKFKLDQLVGKDNYRAEILKERGKLPMKYATLQRRQTLPFKNRCIVSTQF